MGFFSWLCRGDGEFSGGVAGFLGKNRESGDDAERTAEPEAPKKWLILRLECEIPEEFLKGVRGRVVQEQRTGEILGKALEADEKNGELEGRALKGSGENAEQAEMAYAWEALRINIEENRLVLCGTVRLEVAGSTVVSGLILQMLSVCDKLTAARPVQAMIFPKKTGAGGKSTGKAAGSTKKGTEAVEGAGLQGGTKGSGLPELTVMESKNGFRVKTEETAAEAEKALKRLLEGLETGSGVEENGEECVKEVGKKGKKGTGIVAGMDETKPEAESKPVYVKVAGKEEKKGTGIVGRTDEQYIYIEISAKTEVLKPKLTTKQAKQCNTLLASYTTYFETAGSGRARNIAVGAAHLNGAVVYPGEEFSTAAALMPFSPENGYAEGGTFVNGEVAESIGGGVCQISSTLYNALLQTELPVTKRYAHSMPVAYVPLGRDAAIAGDYKDLRFKNTTEVPVLVLCEVEGKKVTVLLYGTATAKKEGVRFRQVTTKETAEEVWVETYREFPDADGRMLTEKLAESRYRYPR